MNKRSLVILKYLTYLLAIGFILYLVISILSQPVDEWARQNGLFVSSVVAALLVILLFLRRKYDPDFGRKE